MKPLTIDEKVAILLECAYGATQRQAAENAGTTEATVSRVVSRWEKEHTVMPVLRPGRPPKFTERDSRHVLHIIHKNRRMCLKDIVRTMPNMSVSSVRRIIHEKGYSKCVAKEKPYLEERTKKARIEFARQHKDWSVADWNKVVWTDEAHFVVGEKYGNVAVWRKKDERDEEDCLAPKFKAKGTCFMVWGAFAGRNKSQLVVRKLGKDAKWTAKTMIGDVYPNTLLPFLDTITNPILMEDNAPIHAARMSQQWRDEHSIKKMDWPANSPDLNPMENVWHIMKYRIGRSRCRLSHAKDFPLALQQLWDGVSSDRLMSLVAGMPKRIMKLLTRRGGSLKY